MTYSEYKDSEVDWIGEIPAGWEMKKLKFISDVTLGKMLTPEDKGNYHQKSYLRSENIQIERVDISDVKEMWFSEKELDKYRLRTNDLLVNEGGDIGRTAIWLDEIDEVYIQNSVNRVRFEDNSSVYFLFQFVLYHAIGQFDSIVNRVSIPHLTKEKLINVSFIVPPLQEQQEIVDYLDHKTQQIDSFIEKTNEKIEILKEQRIAIINQVVTKGLDPDAEMKDSGVEWIGEIPVGWEVKKIKHVAKIITGNTPSKIIDDFYCKNSNDGFLWAKPKDLDVGFSCVNTTEETLTNAGKDTVRIVPADSVMVCCIGNTIGKHSISGQELSTNQQINSVIPNQNLLVSRFSLYYINVFTRDLLYWANFVTLPLYTKTDLNNTSIILPPLQEQQEIVDYLDRKTQQIDSQVERELQRIELLKEYRNSLISEVVTGQIDVRGELVA